MENDTKSVREEILKAHPSKNWNLDPTCSRATLAPPNSRMALAHTKRNAACRYHAGPYGTSRSPSLCRTGLISRLLKVKEIVICHLYGYVSYPLLLLRYPIQCLSVLSVLSTRPLCTFTIRLPDFKPSA